MNSYEEIKKLVESSRKMLSKTINESSKTDIIKKYQILTEQDLETALDEKTKEYETAEKKEKDSDDIGTQRDKQKAYKIQGNVLVLHGKDESKIQLTTDEKNAFIESVDEFRNDVAELVDFGKMNVFDENVEWSGKVLEIDLEFFYSINEPHGIYVNGNMVKLDQEYMEMIGKLQTNYEKFKTKWSKIVASRQKS